MNSNSGVSLTHLDLLNISGRDAAAFLQGLTSNDLGAIGPQGGQLSSVNSARGRVEAVIRVLRYNESYRIILPGDLVPFITEHLRRYILRADVIIKNPEPAVTVLGLNGRKAVEAIGEFSSGGTDTDDVGTAQAVTWSSASARWICTVPNALVSKISRVLDISQNGQSLTTWQRQDVADGLPMIVSSTRGLFLPQMINLDLLGAINFTKGCYTGQEIIARTQHLGRVKRRMFRFSTATEAMPQPGQPLFQDGQIVGTVVNAANTPRNHADLLAVVNMAALAGRLDLAADNSMPLRQRDMAYDVDASTSG